MSRPAFSRANCSTTGATERQGPHHGAQKSTSTGTRDDSIALPSSDASTGCDAPETSSVALHRPHTGLPLAPTGTLLSAPHDLQRYMTVSPWPSNYSLTIQDWVARTGTIVSQQRRW